MLRFCILLGLVAIAFANVATDGTLGSIPDDAAGACATPNKRQAKTKILKKCSGNLDPKRADASNIYDLMSGSENATNVCQLLIDKKNCLMSTITLTSCKRLENGIAELIRDSKNSLSGICNEGALVTGVAAELDAVNDCLATKPILINQIIKMFGNGARPNRATPRRRRRSTEEFDEDAVLERERRSVANITALRILAKRAINDIKTAKTNLTQARTALQAERAKTPPNQATIQTLQTTLAAADTAFKAAQTAAATAQRNLKTALNARTATILQNILNKVKALAKAGKNKKPKPIKKKVGKSDKSFGASLKSLSKDQREALIEEKKSNNMCKRLKGKFNFMCRIGRKLNNCTNSINVMSGLKKLVKLQMPDSCTFTQTVCPPKLSAADRINGTRKGMCILGLVHNKPVDSDDVTTCRDDITGDFEAWFETDTLKIEIKRAAFTPKSSSFAGVAPQYVSEIKVTHLTDAGNEVDSMTFTATSPITMKYATAQAASLPKGAGKVGSTDPGLSKKIDSMSYNIKSLTGTRIKDRNSGCFIAVYSNTDRGQRVYNLCVRCAKALGERASGAASSGCENPADNVISTARRRRATSSGTANDDAATYDAAACTNCEGVNNMGQMETDAESDDNDILGLTISTTVAPAPAPSSSSMVTVNVFLMVAAILAAMFY